MSTNRATNPGPVRFRAGLVGAGHISEFHIQALRRIPFVEIVGVHDLDRTQGGGAGRALRAPGRSTRWRRCARRAPTSSTSSRRRTPTRRWRPRRCAPAATSSSRSRWPPTPRSACGCAISARAQGLEIGVSHSLLFDPQVKSALEAVRARRARRARSAVDILRSSMYPPYAGGPLPPQYRTAGYPFRDLGIHGLYLLEAFLGPIAEGRRQWRRGQRRRQPGFQRLARAGRAASAGWGSSSSRSASGRCSTRSSCRGPGACMRLDLFLMFQASRRRRRCPSRPSGSSTR